MSVLSVRSCSVATCLFFILASIPAAFAQQAAKCQVDITTPQPGDKVGQEGRVRGAATIPRGTYLWVLVHMKDLVAEWWPQGRHSAVIGQDGKWVIIAAYGQAKDVQQEFEVAAVVVDANTNAGLLDWFKTAEEKHYPPIEFPSTVQGCVPVKVTVIKTSH
jgi:hypothetical protein